MYNWIITKKEKVYLRELAKKQLEYSMLPIMKTREKQWYQHNDLKSDLPMITFETWTCADDILPPSQCQSEAAKKIETAIHMNIINHELIDDDTVVPAWYSIHWDPKISLFGVEVGKEYAKDSAGRNVGHVFNYVIGDLKQDLPSLGDTKYSVNKESVLAWKAFVEDIIGDILPVKLSMESIGICPTQDVVHLMGMENMMFAMMDYPDEFHLLMKRLTKDYKGFLRWIEKENLLLLNNGNTRLNQGSYGFTHNLPGKALSSNQEITTKQLWGYMDSQESVSISPAMYKEFLFPYYHEIASEFGLFSYGCCEPVDPIWEDCVSKYPRLRKVSISPWCDETYMGSALKGSDTIYHRKPSPNFIGVGKELDEEAYTEHILKTLKATKGCKLEFSFRDIYTLEGNKDKPRRAIEILRQLIDKENR